MRAGVRLSKTHEVQHRISFGCVYLVEQSEHVAQHVRDRHVQELSKVVQVQLLTLQLPGPVAVLLQNLLRVLRLQPGGRREGSAR